MLYNFSIKNTFALFFLTIGIFTFCFTHQTYAYLLPTVSVNTLKITSSDNNQIKGEFTAQNRENYYMGNLNYEIQLLSGTSLDKLSLVTTNVSVDKFFINPNGTFTKSFVYNYPKNINTGEYTLFVRILTENGDQLGWNSKTLSLEGNNKFLNIVSGFSGLLTSKEEGYPLQGLNILPEENAVGFLSVENIGDEITVVPVIKIFARQVNMPIVKEYQDLPITIAKKETKKIRLNMPKFDVPESYLAEVKFYQNNEQISGIQYFRWVVVGSSGKILNVKIEKDFYKAGENMNIIIDSVGPADFSDSGVGKLEITVSDKNGNIVSNTSKDVSLNSNVISSIITILVEKDLLSPIVDVKLIKDKNVLDTQNIALTIFSKEAQNLQKEINNKKMITYLVYLLSFILIISILLTVLFIYKKKKTLN